MTRQTLLDILNFARWAPSGDNTQPWRFEIVSEDRVLIHGSDTRTWCVYDFRGHASHIAHGALLETLRIAATAYGLEAEWARCPKSSDENPVYEVIFLPRPDIEIDPLAEHICKRTVQRRPMQSVRLTGEQRLILIQSVGTDYSLNFFESFGERLSIAKLLWQNAKIRLTCQEAYHVHRQVIEWNTDFSTDKIPSHAVGADPLSLWMMRWAMASWRRVKFLNRYLGGTMLPRIELDFIPALRCSAHVLLRPNHKLSNLEAYVHAGGAMQRLWLTATSLGLQLQPEMTPIIFRWYARSKTPFSEQVELHNQAEQLAGRIESLAQVSPETDLAFFCRIGVSNAAKARSLRVSLDDLIIPSK